MAWNYDLEDNEYHGDFSEGFYIGCCGYCGLSIYDTTPINSIKDKRLIYCSKECHTMYKNEKEEREKIEWERWMEINS